MYFGSCCQIPNVGLTVFVYGVANFLAFVGETTYSIATIAEMPESDHYPEYFWTAINGVVRVMTMSMCAWWIMSANQARTTGMKIAFAWILLRAVGNVMYAYGSVLYETVIMPENLMSLLGIGNTFSPTTRIASATGWLLGEAFVLSRMHVFYCLVTAPDHWQDHEKERALAVDKKPADVPTK